MATVTYMQMKGQSCVLTVWVSHRFRYVTIAESCTHTHRNQRNINKLWMVFMSIIF